MCSSKEKTTWYNYYIFLICVPFLYTLGILYLSTLARTTERYASFID